MLVFVFQDANHWQAQPPEYSDAPRTEHETGLEGQAESMLFGYTPQRECGGFKTIYACTAENPGISKISASRLQPLEDAAREPKLLWSTDSTEPQRNQRTSPNENAE
jgi:hypothetical protein